MSSLMELTTERLLLRQWKYADIPIFEKINADPEVMQYFPGILSTEESRAMAENIRDKINEKGWGFWAVERTSDNQFIGFVGLNEPAYAIPVSPCVEVGWRLGREYWGNGYATEAAKQCLEIGFSSLGLQEIYSFTSVLNTRSQAVMERIGMTNTFTSFEHPMIAVGHILREHVLYKAVKDSWAHGV